MSKLFTKMLFPVMAVFVLVVLNVYFVEAKSLEKGDVYRSLDGDEAIEIISSSELEISKKGQDIIVAAYDFKGDKLLVAASVEGVKTVRYYLLTEEGLKDEKTGKVYYTKAAFVKAEEQMRKAEEKERNASEELKKSMVLVKGGCYQMGDTFGDGKDNEKPVHEACVDDFYMGKYEVTQILWEAIMGDNPSTFKGCDQCPVEKISWNDAQEFINKLNQKTGEHYRLPTEAEWEYAARSGGKDEKYAGTSDESGLGDYAWYKEDVDSRSHPVGQKKPNGLELYDMNGNVWEWVADWYGEGYYSGSPKNNPKGPDSGQSRMLRGGSWYGLPENTRATSRYWRGPALRNYNYGFRLAVSAK